MKSCRKIKDFVSSFKSKDNFLALGRGMVIMNIPHMKCPEKIGVYIACKGGVTYEFTVIEGKYF